MISEKRTKFSKQTFYVVVTEIVVVKGRAGGFLVQINNKMWHNSGTLEAIETKFASQTVCHMVIQNVW